VTQSIVNGERQEADLDMISVIPGKYLTGSGWWDDWLYTGIWQNWPIGTNTIQLTGTFSWETTPEQVKRAVTLMVYDAIKPQGDPLHRAAQWSTSNFQIVRANTNPTGIPEVDNIIDQFTRNRVPAI
jgi:hypothetical protein